MLIAVSESVEWDSRLKAVSFMPNLKIRYSVFVYTVHLALAGQSYGNMLA